MNDFFKDLKFTENKEYILEIEVNSFNNCTIWGIIEHFSEEYILISKINKECFSFEGYSIIKIEYITRYRFFDTDNDFLFLVQKKVNLFKQKTFRICSSSFKKVLRKIAKEYKLFSFYKKNDLEKIYVGKILKITNNTIIMKEIDADADWYDDVTKFTIESLAVIDFGGRYEKVLWLVGKDDL